MNADLPVSDECEKTSFPCEGPAEKVASMNVKSLLRESFARLVIWSGLAMGVRAVLWRDRVAVLLYHDPRPEILDSHLGYLKRICDIVPLADLDKPGNGRPRAVITLDDGHAGNAALLPVFIKHGVRPTIFICSDVVGHPRMHWWMHPAAMQTDTERLKRLPNRDRLRELAALGCDEQVSVNSGRVDPAHGGGDMRPTGLSTEQLEALRPYVDFQSHTRSHPILTRCDDAECEDEIAGSRCDIEQLTGQTCEHFAYPNGNYGEREIRLLKAAGYRTARTCDVGWNDQRTDRMRLRAIDIHDDSTLTWFAAQLTGIPLFLRYWRQGGGLAGRKPQF
jgi:peptidoglycan/xylan/chitin deacetylase (PgdA/CDA1 family)